MMNLIKELVDCNVAIAKLNATCDNVRDKNEKILQKDWEKLKEKLS